ncbi:Xaa-Pro peptidase family protein [Microbacterium sp. SS28]|uniref:M24 family metallopeptidase n=1 Tax=Microbacterium sp. SS28 TaxID=2919948 RepID=UPI001FAA8AC7|nr:M24 family metallopeptidase [Microbacterium sp. SS28]
MLTSHEAVSWYLEGIRSHVSLAGPPVLAVRVDAGGDTLFVADNEADRLVAEELLPSDASRIVRVPWLTPPAEAAAQIGAAGGEASVAPALRAARASLLPAERDRYRSLCRDAAEAMTDAAALLRPEMTERVAAAELAEGLVARGIDPLVILVAGESRVAHRHPLPTAAVLGRRAMLVACGRRHGLIANVTRWVGASGPSRLEGPAPEAILEVETAFLDATRPGARLDEVFAAGTAGYAAAGFDADEWRRHHQGGPTGYAGRDPRATPATADLVQENHAFAWNPSAPGVKVEDTVLVSSAGVEVLTVDPRWPTVRVGALDRPVARPY